MDTTNRNEEEEMKTITTVFDSIVYSRFVLKYGLLFAAVAFTLGKCTNTATN